MRHPTGVSDLAQYRAVIAAAMERQAAGQDIDRGWMMMAARTRATRWDGLQSVRQSQVAASFIAEPSVDAGLAITMALLSNQPGEALDDAFASGIDVAVASSNPYALMRSISPIAALVARRRCTIDRRLVGDLSTPAGIRAWWAVVRRDCGITPRAIEGVAGWAALGVDPRPD